MVGHHLTAYAAAKAGICRFTDQHAVELFGTSIRVNCMQPGQVWSEDRLRAVAAGGVAHGRARPGPRTQPSSRARRRAGGIPASRRQRPAGRIASVDEDWWRDPRQVQAVAQSLHAYCLRRVTL